MVPNSGPDPYAANESQEGMSDDEKVEANAAAEVAVPVDSILNLDYRQGTDLPQLKWGFTDSHFICFPYETRRTGIYACGPVRRPMDIKQAQDDATGAAMKAIQAAVNAGQGSAAHPRVGDLSYPSFRKEGCTQCKRCTVECPFGAINEDEQRYPLFNESRCRRCGTCMGACPVRVISFENYSIDTVGQQIKNVDMPDVPGPVPSGLPADIVRRRPDLFAQPRQPPDRTVRAQQRDAWSCTSRLCPAGLSAASPARPA